MRVSIAIPCFNAERWLRTAIASALAQRGIEPEVIVVDDGSTDGSAAIAHEFGDRIRFIGGPNRGGNHARNLALENASTEWIQFLDADDYLEPHKIETQLREANLGGGEADILYSPVWIETWSDDKAVAREQSQTCPNTDLDTQWIRWQIPQTGGALWRRDALSRIGGWKLGQPCCQEHELYLRARKAGLRFVYTPTPGAVYRIWSEETVCRKDPTTVIQARTQLLDEMLAWLEQSGKATEAHRREIGKACFEMARTWSRFDLATATAYHSERNTKGLIHAAGQAAPLSYRALYRTLGFTNAERVARWLR